LLSSTFRSCSIDSDRMKSVKHTIIDPSVRATIRYFAKRIYKEVCSGKNQSRKIFKGCLASLGYKNKIRSHYDIKCSLLSTKYNNIFNLIGAFVPDWKKATTRGSGYDTLLLVCEWKGPISSATKFVKVVPTCDKFVSVLADYFKKIITLVELMWYI